MPATSADNGYGATFGISDGAGGFTTVAEVFSITPPNRSRESIDASNLESPDGYREFIPGGLIDAGEVTLELNYVPSASHVLEAELEKTTVESYEIAFPGGSVTLTFSGYCMSFEPGPLTADDRMTLTATFKVTGKPTLA